MPTGSFAGPCVGARCENTTQNYGPAAYGRPVSPLCNVCYAKARRLHSLVHPQTRRLSAEVHGRVVRIGREALRSLLACRGITFQRTKTWKESPDPERDAKLDRIEHVVERFPDRISRSTSSVRSASGLPAARVGAWPGVPR